MTKTWKIGEFGKFKRSLPIVLAAAVVVGVAGCKQQAAPKTDQQVATDIQAKINAEQALNGQNIVINVQDGRATLSGTTTDDASRALAANDAGSIDGVKTVINNLTVRTAQAAQPAQPAQLPQQASAAPSSQTARIPSQTTRDLANDKAQERKHQERQQAAAALAAQQAAAQADQAANQAPNLAGQAPNQAGNEAAAASPLPPPVPAPAPEPVQPVAPPPPPPPVARTVTVPAGTILAVRMTDSLDSASTQSGSTFRAALANDLVVNGMVAAPRGATVIGRVVDAKDASHFKGSSLLSIELTTLDAHGQQIGLTTDAFSKEGTGRGRNTATKAGVGAGLGAVIGALAGGGKGAAIGAAAGGGLGAGSNGITRGQQVQIPSETLVNFTLSSDIFVSTAQRVGDPRSFDSQQGPELQKRQ